MLDIPMIWLHGQCLKCTCIAIFIPTGRNKADMNTNPHEGVKIQIMNMAIVEYEHYPPEESEHYRIIQLDQYNIGPHRGSFLLNARLTALEQS